MRRGGISGFQCRGQELPGVVQEEGFGVRRPIWPFHQRNVEDIAQFPPVVRSQFQFSSGDRPIDLLLAIADLPHLLVRTHLRRFEGGGTRSSSSRASRSHRRLGGSSCPSASPLIPEGNREGSVVCATASIHPPSVRAMARRNAMAAVRMYFAEFMNALPCGCRLAASPRHTRLSSQEPTSRGTGDHSTLAPQPPRFERLPVCLAWHSSLVTRILDERPVVCRHWKLRPKTAA